MRTDVSVDMPGLAWTVHEVLGGFPMDVRCHETSAGLLSAPSAPLGLSFSSPSAPPIPLALPMSAADMDVSHAPVLKAALSLAAEVPQREKELRALINNAIVLAPEQRPRAAELLAHFLKSVGCPCGPLSGSRGSPHWRGKERENRTKKTPRSLKRRSRKPKNSSGTSQKIGTQLMTGIPRRNGRR
mmetsp:Transcript_31171/g.61448  ORF Transcript_31171/g.61448 Transcript_31171/m.61448 type:complete len:186 (+) Transcript_31171:1-558(+)